MSSIWIEMWGEPILGIQNSKLYNLIKNYLNNFYHVPYNFGLPDVYLVLCLT